LQPGGTWLATSDLCPRPTAGFSAPAAAQLAQLLALERRALHKADHAELVRRILADRSRDFLRSISTRPGSVWLDAIPYPPSIRLGDQAFQDAASVPMGVRTIYSFEISWTCAFSDTVEGDNIAHALG
jgi:hypothetical protein